MTDPDVRRHADRPAVASAMADDVVDLLRTSTGDVRIVLTGGTVARDLHRAVAERSSDVDWSRVTVLWGDERFVPLDDEERNDRQATEDLLSQVPVGSVLRMPSPDDDVNLEEGVNAYAAVVELLVSKRDEPALDLVMLGVGPDGHVASLFPGHDHPSGALVVGEADSPKPPPERISLSMSLLCRASRVWFVAAGEEKADAVAGSVHGDRSLPAGVVRGADETRWYVDEAAASRL